MQVIKRKKKMYFLHWNDSPCHAIVFFYLLPVFIRFYPWDWIFFFFHVSMASDLIFSEFLSVFPLQPSAPLSVHNTVIIYVYWLTGIQLDHSCFSLLHMPSPSLSNLTFYSSLFRIGSYLYSGPHRAHKLTGPPLWMGLRLWSADFKALHLKVQLLIQSIFNKHPKCLAEKV